MARRAYNSGQVTALGRGVELPATFGFTANGLTTDTLVSGVYYGNGINTGFTLLISGGNTFAVPFFVSTTQTFDRIGINVTTQAATAGAVGRLGIASFVAGLPTTLIVDAGTVAIDSTGEKAATISQTLSVGWYGLVIAPSHNVTIRAVSSSVDLGRTGLVASGPRFYFSQSVDYSAGLPTTFNLGINATTGTTGLYLALRAA